MNSASNDPTSIKEKNSEEEPEAERFSASFPVAGIGASAGGVEAIISLLENLPGDTGIAYVVIMHLSSEHESILPDLLAKKSPMPVHKVEDGMKVEMNHVYVIPPDTYMSIVDGHLALYPRDQKGGHFLPIDFFFKGIAQVYQNKAIGILLSGTASDGTSGFEDIKAEGGITFAQDASAQFIGMPKSAIDAGFVDFILPPKLIARELHDILKLPYTSLSHNEINPDNENELRRILIILHHKKGVDFSLYKHTTINRRILRRMALNRKESLEAYSQMLREDLAEINQLYQDLLINVTSFFREPALFTALTQKVLPALLKGRKLTDPVRIWIPACATGEEACSFAITLFEFFSERGLTIPFQIFATDLNEAAIEKARTGIYHSANLENVPQQYLQKYFIRIDGHYQVNKSIRDSCVFATHNLLTDPPFSRIDIVSCQNVMIYFEPNAQKKILKSFNYALKPKGFLFLGKSETVGSSANLFSQTEKEVRIYTKKENSRNFDFDFLYPAMRVLPEARPETDKLNSEKRNETDIEKETDKLLLSDYVPASVVINSELQILRFHGPTSQFLQPAFGKASLDLLKMVREDLVFEVKKLINKAKKEGSAVRKEGVHINRDGIAGKATIEVVPLRPSSSEPFFLILFRDAPDNPVHEKKIAKVSGDNHLKDQRIVELELELRELREHLKILGEEFEANREELQSANEEVLSSNEELQSINEELETSKEELQSTNEELTTINDELQHRNKDLKEAFEYTEAIVETISEPLLVLNTELRVKTANKAFYKIFQQKQQDIEGYFIYEMANRQWNITGLKNRLLEMISKSKSFENFEARHVLPELGERVILFNAIRMIFDDVQKNRILLVIEDITQGRKAEDDLKHALKINTSILNSISDTFISVNNNWNIAFINEQGKKFLGAGTVDLIGKNLWEICSQFKETEFYRKLTFAMEEKNFAQFEFYDQRTKDWYHFRVYPSEEQLSIYANRITEQKVSRELILQSKERYETFISESTEGIWRLELKEPISTNLPKEKQLEELYKNAYVAESNDAMAKIYNYKDADEMRGVGIGDVLSRNEQNDNSLLQFIDANYHLADTETTVIKNYKKIYFLCNFIGIIRDGKIIRIWGTQRDITQQKLAQQNLIKTRNQLNFLLAAGSVGTFIWDFKTNKIHWTKVQESLYGLEEYSFNGTLEDWLQFIHPEDVEPTRKAIEQSLMEQKELSVEFRTIWPDKSVHWILTRANTFFDNDGKAVEMSGINIEISERKFKEQLIQENEERFRALVQNSFDVITVFNYDGTITYQSDSIERILGYTVAERLGKNIYQEDLVHHEDRQIEKRMFEECVEKPYAYIQGEFRMLHKNGGYRIMEVGCINLANNSSIHGIIQNFRDITERRMEEKQKEEFIGIASHELKTPVTSIKAYTQILYETLKEKDDHYSADLLLKMDHQIDRLTTLIKDLLDVTKISEGRLDIRHEKFDLNELIDEVVQDMQLTTKKQTILKELQELKPIKGDRERTAQVIVNLLSNAIKYSPHADKVIIKTSVVDEEVVVSIQDFGIGISKEMQKKLFRRFFRVTDETSSTFPGLGLGLFISTEIIKKQKGRIWVESTPKEGSTFSFTLPL